MRGEEQTLESPKRLSRKGTSDGPPVTGVESKPLEEPKMDVWFEEEGG
jgi:hypothetical protein